MERKCQERVEKCSVPSSLRLRDGGCASLNKASKRFAADQEHQETKVEKVLNQDMANE